MLPLRGKADRLMSFDAALLSLLVAELDSRLGGGKIEKIYQPSRDEIVFAVKQGGAALRLLINAGSAAPRINITAEKSENPATPPTLCMMLRKYLGGAKIESVAQLGFDRVVRITFDCYDELGYKTKRHLIAELMGKYCNIIFTDAQDKILYVMKPIDFSASTVRQLLAGMIYELPPQQKNKLDPRSVDRRTFMELARNADQSRTCEKFITSSFLGLASSTARELAYVASGNVAATLAECDGERLWCAFEALMRALKLDQARPTVVSLDGKLTEYGYLDYAQYGSGAEITHPQTYSQMIDEYFLERSRADSLRTRAYDIFRLLGNAEARIVKKIDRQTLELADCDKGEEYKLWADLITANIYRLKKGSDTFALENYYDDMKIVEIPVSERLTPAQNAAVYYKKYNKAKSAKIHLDQQLKLSRAELDYVYSVLDALSRAETQRELSEIREELYHSGYASKMRNYSSHKAAAPSVLKFKTDGGYTVLCGKNNTANDYLTMKLADKNDWWFHVKNQPGSHVVLVAHGDEKEPPELDFTQAAEIAAYYSKASGGENIAVDYMKVRGVKKPPSSKPGYVIYNSNWTAYVTPDGKKIAAMQVK